MKRKAMLMMVSTAWLVLSLGLRAESAEETAPLVGYRNPDLIPQAIRTYAQGQPVAENPWKSVSRAAGYKTQDEYLLQTYPNLKKMYSGETLQAAMIGVKRTLLPILEKGPNGEPNPVLAFLREKVSQANMKAILRETPESLALLYFHAQSPFATMPPEVRTQVRDALMATLRQRYINPNQIEVPNGGGGPYQGRNVYFVYLLIEIFEPDLLTVEEKQALNTQLLSNFFGFNAGQNSLMADTMNPEAALYNHSVFSVRNWLEFSTLFRLQKLKYTGDKDLWKGMSADWADHWDQLNLAAIRNYWAGFMGDGARRYIHDCTHCYFYEGPQFVQTVGLWGALYDEDDPRFLAAADELRNQIVAQGNYYLQNNDRIIRKDPDTNLAHNRAQMSEGKDFGLMGANRDSDDPIHWMAANVSGNNWLRMSPAALRYDTSLSGKRYHPVAWYGATDMIAAAAWNPAVKIEPRREGEGFFGDYILWDRNNLGAIGEAGDFSFQLVSRTVTGRKRGPDHTPDSLFEMNTHAGFVFRNADSPPSPKGLRTDHWFVNIPRVGIHPVYRAPVPILGKRGIQSPKEGTLIYRPHYSSIYAAPTVTDRFAALGVNAGVAETALRTREFWLATPSGAVGWMESDVDENPAGGAGQARLSIGLSGYFGTGNGIRQYRTRDGFQGLEKDPTALKANPMTYPVLHPDKAGFDFLNAQVNVLENNFPGASPFSWIKGNDDMLPTEKASADLSGFWEESYFNDADQGLVGREVEARGTFSNAQRPRALLSFQTSNAKQSLLAKTVPGRKEAGHPYLALSVVDGDQHYWVIHNPEGTPLDLRGLPTFDGQEMVYAFQSGALYRPDFTGNIELDPELDRQDMVSFGSVVQVPVPRPLNEACQILVPPYAHLILVAVSPQGIEPKTGGPGFEVSPALAEWNFNPEQVLDGPSGKRHRELTGRFGAMVAVSKDGVAMLPKDGSGVTMEQGGALPPVASSGTVSFWIKPDFMTASGGADLFMLRSDAQGPCLELIRKTTPQGGRLVLQWTGNGKGWAREFAADLIPRCWQQLSVTYGESTLEKAALYLNGRPITGGPITEVKPPNQPTGILIGQGISGALDNLAIHTSVLSQSETAFLVDREQPEGFNRIYFKRSGGGGLRVWLNGTAIVPFKNRAKSVADTGWIYPFLKKGQNILAVELDPQPRSANGSLETVIRIHGQDLTADGNAFAAAWRQASAASTEVGSLIELGNQQAKVFKQALIDQLKAKGLNPGTYKGMDWITPCYDRPWLNESDSLSWQPVTWQDTKMTLPVLKGQERLLLLRFKFDVDANSVPKPIP